MHFERMDVFYYYTPPDQLILDPSCRMARCLKLTTDKLKTFDYDEQLRVENMMETLKSKGIIRTKEPSNKKSEIVSFEDIVFACMSVKCLNTMQSKHVTPNPLYFDLDRAAETYGENFITDIIKFVMVTKLREVVEYFDSFAKNEKLRETLNSDVPREFIAEGKYLKNINLNKNMSSYAEVFESQEIDKSLRFDYPFKEKDIKGNLEEKYFEYEKALFLKKLGIGGARTWMKYVIIDYDCCCKGCFGSNIAKGL